MNDFRDALRGYKQLMGLVKSPLPAGLLRSLEADPLAQMTVNLTITEFSPFTTLSDVNYSAQVQHEQATQGMPRRSVSETDIGRAPSRRPSAPEVSPASGARASRQLPSPASPAQSSTVTAPDVSAPVQARRPLLAAPADVTTTTRTSTANSPAARHASSGFPPLPSLPEQHLSSTPALPHMPYAAQVPQLTPHNAAARQDTALTGMTETIERIGQLANEVLQARREQRAQFENSPSGLPERQGLSADVQTHAPRRPTFPGFAPLNGRAQPTSLNDELPPSRPNAVTLPEATGDQAPHPVPPAPRPPVELNDDALVDHVNAVLVRQARRYGIKL